MRSLQKKSLKFASEKMLSIKPITLKSANEFVKQYHRHNLPTVGCKFAIACYDNNRLCGVAICGRPTARNADDGKTLEIYRNCTDGTYNVCSKLYGACIRVSKEMGYEKVITYTLDSENGASVLASNFSYDGRAGLPEQTGHRQKSRSVAPKEYKKRYVYIIKEDKQMAKKHSFDTAILKDIKSVAGDSFADNIKMLPVDQLHDNPENFYDLSDLDTLVEDIDRQGLKTPLYVVPDDDGYIVISGHRRKAAVQQLIDNGKYGTDKLPCYIGVKKGEAETMLDLIMLNATSRVISDSETVKQCEKLEEAFKQLEADGKKVQGRMRDKIAAALNVSPAQVGKVENIRHNAIDEVKAAVNEGKMSISTANEVAKLEPEKQKDLIEKKKPEEITHKEIKKSVEAAQKTSSPSLIQKLNEINDRLDNGEDVSVDEIDLDETNLHTLQLLNATEKPQDITHKEIKDTAAAAKKTASSKKQAEEIIDRLEHNEDEDFEDITLDVYNNNSTSDDRAVIMPTDEEDMEMRERAKAAAEAMKELWVKPPEYFNEIIDSGMCNSIITGYIMLVLEELKVDYPKNILHIINSIFDTCGAQTARGKFRNT